MIVTSTADVLAIIGGGTTFVAAVFAAVRLSRCQTVTCCWGALNLVNKPIPTPPLPPPSNYHSPVVKASLHNRLKMRFYAIGTTSFPAREANVTVGLGFVRCRYAIRRL